MDVTGLCAVQQCKTWRLFLASSDFRAGTLAASPGKFCGENYVLEIRGFGPARALDIRAIRRSDSASASARGAVIVTVPLVVVQSWSLCLLHVYCLLGQAFGRMAFYFWGFQGGLNFSGQIFPAMMLRLLLFTAHVPPHLPPSVPCHILIFSWGPIGKAKSVSLTSFEGSGAHRPQSMHRQRPGPAAGLLSISIHRPEAALGLAAAK